MRKKWLVVIAAAVLLVGAIVAYAALFTKFLDPAEYDSFAAEEIVPSELQGPYVPVTGTVVVVSAGQDQSESWSGDLELDGDRDVGTLSFNAGTRFEFPPESRPASGTPMTGSPFPYQVLGFRFEGRAKIVRTGLFGLFRHPVLVDGRFIHPGD